MAVHEIEIEITPEGIVKGNITGIKGQDCKELAAILAEIVGQEISFSPSSEFFEAEQSAGVDVEERFQR